jgi:hypothetical protein
MSLPTNLFRCHPNERAPMCMDCARWADLPGQTWGQRTQTRTATPDSVMCEYIPIAKEKTS